MKTMRAVSSGAVVIVLALLCTTGQACFAQGSFTNLDFEAARITLDTSSPYYPYAAIATRALPGWSFDGFRPGGSDIGYDSGTAGSAAVSIHDTNTYLGLVPILQGRYSAFLQGEYTFNPNAVSVSLWQTGQIPLNAQSMTFWGGDFAATFQITFNGQYIPFGIIGSGANYNIYGGDISAFAGQTGELRFTALPRTESGIDNIQFSNQPIPEPSGLVLFGLGTLFLSIYRFTARRSACG
jgi:hypothetical protein